MKTFLLSILFTSLASCHYSLPDPGPSTEAQLYKNIRYYQRLLEKYAPTSMPVTVLIADIGPDYLGNTNMESGRFIIRINSYVHHDFVWEILAHEWAHCLAYPKMGHHDQWGALYARCYRISYENSHRSRLLRMYG